jgi:hypothetical protein
MYRTSVLVFELIYCALPANSCSPFDKSHLLENTILSLKHVYTVYAQSLECLHLHAPIPPHTDLLTQTLRSNTRPRMYR